jgi:lipopolysaccharide assembly protein A
MRALIAIFWTFIFLLLFWIALKNADPVTLRLTTGTDLTAPLIIVLLAAFASGLILGMLAASPRLFRQGREIKRLKKTVSVHTAKGSDTGSMPQNSNPLPPY